MEYGYTKAYRCEITCSWSCISKYGSGTEGPHPTSLVRLGAGI